MKKKLFGDTRSLGAFAAFGLAFALTLVPLTAHAQQATNGQNGGNAGTNFGGHGANGANGSDGVLLSGVNSAADGTFTAGSGGSGGSGNNDVLGDPNFGGTGGSGGNAAVAQPGAAVTVTGGAFTAGSGGNGGGGSLGTSGGNGGNGGSALVALVGSTITVTGGTFRVGHNGSAGVPAPYGGAGGHAGYDLFANGGAITVYGYGFSAGPALTGSGTLTATIGGVTQTLSYSVSPAAGSAIFLKTSGTLATITTPTSSPNPSLIGQPVTLTAAVTPSGPATAAPTGSVAFQQGNVLLGTAPLTNGTATLTTSALTDGSDTLTAYYTGDSSFAGSNASFVQTVNVDTQTTLTSSLNPSTVGQSVTFTAAVSSSFIKNGPTPTGTVQFAIDGINAGGPVTLDSNGKATDTATGLTVDPHTITVTYAPTGAFLSNTGATLTQTVNPLVTQTTLTSSLNPSVAGQSVTFTAAVSSNAVTPTGTVQFAIDGINAGGPVTLDSNGKATDTETALTPGTHTVSAAYLPTGIFPADALATLTQTVNPLVTQTTLTSSLNPSVAGQSVTFTAAVSSNAVTSTGTVQFAIDGINAGGPVTLDSNGQAMDTTTGLTLGTHTVSVTYAPTGPFTGNAGATLTQVVNPYVSAQYVSPSGSDLNDGSQASPKQTIQAAVNATQSGDTVTVEDGTYTGDGNRDIDFGGRNITVRSASGDPTRTIIDCGFEYLGTQHGGFFFHSGETSAVVSGLTIANGAEGPGNGAAVDIESGSAVMLRNCILTRHIGGSRGGGVYNNGTLTLTGCAFTANTAANGGGVYNNGTLTLTNCALTANRVSGFGGGLDNGGTMTLTNCTLVGNTARYGGGGIYNAMTATLVNCLLWGDTAPTGSEINGAVTATYCDVQGGFTGTGNINADPLFVNPTAGDLHLSPGSPCLGAGTSAGAPPTDKDGYPRPNPPSIGTYERPAVSHTHLLWNNTDGRVILWSIAPDGAFTENTFGPYTDGTPNTPWTAKAVATGPDGKSHLLWTNPNGRVILWSVDDSGNFTYQVYGPYTDDGTAATPWSAVALSVGADNLVHLLWTNPDGRVILWNVDPAFNFTLQVFGPYTDDDAAASPWQAVALATGPDNVSRLLWTNPDGKVILWKIDDGFHFSYQVYGPYTDGNATTPWSASAVSVGPDNRTHLLWNNPDGKVILWNVDLSFNFTLAAFGPYTDDGTNATPWTATALATGPDNLSHLLWINPDNRILLWGVNSAFDFTDTVYGPSTDGAAQNVWSATAISAGP